MTAASTVDAKKTPISKKEALSIARQADEIWASKGSKLVHIDRRRSFEETSYERVLGRKPAVLAHKYLVV